MECHLAAGAPSRLAERNPPVHSHDFRPSLRKKPEQFASADTVTDSGNAEVVSGCDDALCVGENHLLVSRGAEGARPAVKKLERARPGLSLRLQKRFGDVAKPIHESRPQLRVGEHERFGLLEGLGRPAFYEIAGHGEWRTRKSDERHHKLSLQVPHRLQHIGDVFFGLQRAQAF